MSTSERPLFPMVDMDDYQADAFRTSGGRQLDNQSLAVCALGVAGEAGEVADYVKKVIGHGHALDREKLIKELGDVMWYVAVMAKLLGVTLGEVAIKNIEKLTVRYPFGFSEERSKNRGEE